MKFKHWQRRSKIYIISTLIIGLCILFMLICMLIGVDYKLYTSIFLIMWSLFGVVLTLDVVFIPRFNRWMSYSSGNKIMTLSEERKYKIKKLKLL